MEKTALTLVVLLVAGLNAVLLYLAVRVSNFVLRSISLQQKQTEAQADFTRELLTRIVSNLDDWYSGAVKCAHELAQPHLVVESRRQFAEVAQAKAKAEQLDSIMGTPKMRPLAQQPVKSVLPPEVLNADA